MNMNESAEKNRDKQKEREKETLKNKYVRQARVLFFFHERVKPCTNFPIRAHIEVAPMRKFQMWHLVSNDFQF